MTKHLLWVCLLTALPSAGKHILLERTLDKSDFFPGTERKYWVYVPEQYKDGDTACLYMAFDGVSCNAPQVFDELIAEGKMPVTVGVFTEPGKVRNSRREILRYNRSNEYDMTDDRLALFLEKELLPAVEAITTPDGRRIRLSHKASDRAIYGASSGGIASFNIAWQRPDMFSRIFSAVGTFVSFRGGNDMQAFVRKTEPLPLRIFLQDGTKDAWNPLFGSWYEANRMLESALQFAGYELKCDWGDSGHSSARAAEIFKDVMTWLWEGWPAAVKPGITSNNLLEPLLIPDETWQHDDAVRKNPNKRNKYDAIYPDGTLAVRHKDGTNCLWQYIIDENGKESYGQRFYWLHTMDNTPAKVGPMAFDANGNLFVTTSIGIQICDQNGRVRGILRWLKDIAWPVKTIWIENGAIRITDARNKGFVRKMNIQQPQKGVRPKSQGQG